MGKKRGTIQKENDLPAIPSKKAKRSSYKAFEEYLLKACHDLTGKKCTMDGPALTPVGETVTVPFPKPLSVKLVGSHLTGTELGASPVDAVIVVEYSEVFAANDDLKYIYFHKKQAIMNSLCKALNGTIIDPLAGSFECSFEEKKYMVRFGVSVDKDLKVYRLAPGRMNVLNEDKAATPIYNSLILRDIYFDSIHEYIKNTISKEESVRECLKMIKAWYLKMSFDRYVGMLDSTALTCLFCSWLQENENLKGYESMQIFKGFLTYLSMKNWSEPIQIGKFEGPLPSDRLEVFSITAFAKHSKVVLVDPSGTVNLTANCSVSSLALFSHFAKCLLDCLNSTTPILLESLIVEKCSDLNLFDLVITVKVDSTDLHFELLHPVPIVSQAIKAVSLVLEGLKERILHIAAKQIDDSSFQLLFRLNTEKSFGLVEFGPNPEDSDAVVEFKKLWGPLAGLRKFPNGNVQFAVAWPELSNKRHLIFPTAVKHLLKYHKISNDASFLCDNLDFLLESSNPNIKPFNYFIEAFDQLSAILRETNKLPLSIVQVVPISDTLRYTNVFPSTVEPRVAGRNSPVSEALLVFEKSSKWPEDLQAIKASKHAFLLQIQRVLEQEHNLPCSIDIKGDFLDVFTKSLVFRFRIRVEKELVLLQKEGLIEELERVEHLFEEQPLFHAKIHALSCQNPVFGSTVRMVKRWAASQLFSFIPEEYFEVFSAVAFTDCSLGSSPASVISGFHRTLSLIVDHSVNTPFVFDPNAQLDASTLRDIQKDTKMNIYCSFLKNGKYNVSRLIEPSEWKLLQKIAKATLKLFETETDFTEITVPVLLDHLQSFKIDPLFNNSVLSKRDKKAAEIVDKTVRKAAGPMADFVKSLPGLNLIEAVASKIHRDYGVTCYFDKYSGDHLAIKKEDNIGDSLNGILLLQ